MNQQTNSGRASRGQGTADKSAGSGSQHACLVVVSVRVGLYRSGTRPRAIAQSHTTRDGGMNRRAPGIRVDGITNFAIPKFLAQGSSDSKCRRKLAHETFPNVFFLNDTEENSSQHKSSTHTQELTRAQHARTRRPLHERRGPHHPRHVDVWAPVRRSDSPRRGTREHRTPPESPCLFHPTLHERNLFTGTSLGQLAHERSGLSRPPTANLAGEP